MTFKNKLACSTLTDDQHKRIIRAIDNFFCICFEEEELLREYYWLIEFISSLHRMSFICPREVEKYRVYIKEKYEENLERICQEILKREGVGSEARKGLSSSRKGELIPCGELFTMKGRKLF